MALVGIPVTRARDRPTEEHAVYDLSGEVDHTTRFLLEEYRILFELRALGVKASETRARYFLAIVTATAVAATWISGDHWNPRDSLLALAIVDLLLLLVGLLSLQRLIEGHCSIVTYTRGLNRIRGFFRAISIALPIDNALYLPGYDDRPEFGGFSFGPGGVSIIGFTGVTILLNSALLGALVGITLAIAANAGSEDPIVVAFAAALYAVAGLLGYSQGLIDRRKVSIEAKYGIRFPTPKSDSPSRIDD